MISVAVDCSPAVPGKWLGARHGCVKIATQKADAAFRTFDLF